jgi:biopolymer transport protein ExbB
MALRCTRLSIVPSRAMKHGCPSFVVQSATAARAGCGGPHWYDSLRWRRVPIGRHRTNEEWHHVLEILKAGSYAMLPILLCSAIALAIILERFWSLRRSAIVPPGLGDEVREWARTRKLDPQHLEALRGNSPLGELLASALVVRNRPREVIRERVEDTGRHVVHRLERFLNTLGTIALISPLLGLLGTVFGLITMFFAVMVSGVGDPMKMAGGIGEALVCTAAGLCVAIPAYAFHRYFRGRVGDLVVDMERQVFLLTDELTVAAEAGVAPTPAPVRAARSAV